MVRSRALVAPALALLTGSALAVAALEGINWLVMAAGLLLLSLALVSLAPSPVRWAVTGNRDVTRLLGVAGAAMIVIGVVDPATTAAFDGRTAGTAVVTSPGDRRPRAEPTVESLEPVHDESQAGWSATADPAPTTRPTALDTAGQTTRQSAPRTSTAVSPSLATVVNRARESAGRPPVRIPDVPPTTPPLGPPPPLPSTPLPSMPPTEPPPTEPPPTAPPSEPPPTEPPPTEPPPSEPPPTEPPATEPPAPG